MTRYKNLSQRLALLNKEVQHSDSPLFITVLHEEHGFTAILKKEIFEKSRKRILLKIKKQVGKKHRIIFVDLRPEEGNIDQIIESEIKSRVKENHLPNDSPESKVEPKNKPPSEQCKTCTSWNVVDNAYMCIAGIKNVKPGTRCVVFSRKK